MFHLVVTCVGSKNLDGPSITTSIESLVEKGIYNNIDALFAHWKHSLQKKKEFLSIAREVYKGALWSASMEAFREIQTDKQLWIMSCGYGLISEDTRITGYHATFKKGESDSVYNKDFFTNLKESKVKSQWWELLSNEGIVNSDSPKSIHELVNSSEPDDIIMVVAGKDYHEAIYDDLLKINFDTNLPKLVFIGIKETMHGYEPDIPKPLKPYVIPYSDGTELLQFLRNNLGKCNNVQINSKSATWVIREYNRTGFFPKRMGEINEVLSGGGGRPLPPPVEKRRDYLSKPKSYKDGGKNMTSTDEIRKYVIENLIEPAKNRGLKEITIRAGDVHSALGLKSRMPMVCSALKSKIDMMANIQIINIDAPPSGQGANFYVTYKLQEGND